MQPPHGRTLGRDVPSEISAAPHPYAEPKWLVCVPGLPHDTPYTTFILTPTLKHDCTANSAFGYHCVIVSLCCCGFMLIVHSEQCLPFFIDGLSFILNTVSESFFWALYLNVWCSHLLIEFFTLKLHLHFHYLIYFKNPQKIKKCGWVIKKRQYARHGDWHL